MVSPQEIKNRGGNLVIVGAGEFGDIAQSYFNNDSNYAVRAFAVNREYLNGEQTHNELPLVAVEEMANHYPPADYGVFVALSFTRLNRARAELLATVRAAGYRAASYISPAAFVADNADIGENVFVFENNVIQHKCVVQDNVILWSGACIAHRTVVGKNCFFAPHSVVSGFCNIGENCFIGVNAAVGDKVNIGRDCTIGAGAAVVRDLPDNAVIKKDSPPRENASRRLWKAE